MRRIQMTLAAACATLAMTAGAAIAQTVPPDRLTYVTFSAPVSVPGMTLPAGTYEFKIADSNANRHIVQIFNREGTKLFTTLLAVPATRLQPTGDPVITFKEAPANQPPAVHYWYYAGDLAGNELVYPKNQAQLIANASGEDVMSVDSNGTSIDDWKSGSISRVKPDNTANGDQQSSAQPQSSATSSSTSTSTSTTTADQNAAKPVATTTADQTPATTSSPAADQRPARTMDQSAQPTTAPATTPEPSTAPAPPAPSAAASDNTAHNTAVGTSGRSSLPKTGSELPMVGLIGLIALGGALALRVARTA